MPQPRPALQRLSAPASLHNGDRESEFEGFKGVKWLKINLTRQLKHGLAFSCLWQLVQVYFRRLWGDLSAEKGLSTGFWSALQRRVSSSASLRLALERHSAIQRLPFACTAAPSVRPAARSAALFASASCTLCIVATGVRHARGTSSREGVGARASRCSAGWPLHFFAASQCEGPAAAISNLENARGRKFGNGCVQAYGRPVSFKFAPRSQSRAREEPPREAPWEAPC